jgi:hypothetical protein
MRAHWAYFKYVCRHKWFVYLACRKYKVSLWRALIHDWTKFTPAEWSPYVHSFYNADGSKKDPKTENTTLEVSKLGDAFRLAWNSHQKTNKHHWQYWVLINDEDGVMPLEMPEMYVREMLADWDGAGRAITGKADPAGWYSRNSQKMIMHDQTRRLVESLLIADR